MRVLKADSKVSVSSATARLREVALQDGDAPEIHVGRRGVLRQRRAPLEALPRGAGQVGFYSYGELSPRHRGGYCDLHNQTMTVTLFDEAC